MKKYISLLLSILLITVLLFTVVACNEASQTVNFMVNGELYKTVEINGASITLPDPPEKEGYTFDGWYIDENEWINEFNSDSSLTSLPKVIIVYAKWVINSCTITFDSNEGSEIPAITKNFGDSVTEPQAPEKTGYTFGGWYLDNTTFNTAYTFSIMPAENITLYAKWAINSCTITLDSNGGSEIPAITKNFGESVTEPQAPEKTGYTFGGWYLDNTTFNTVYTFSVMPAENITLYAKWAINSYTITFNSNGGSEISAITKNFGESVAEPQASEKDGYFFGGWYTDNNTFNNVYTFSTMSAGNITLFAKWDKAYTITFESNGGSAVAVIVNKAGGTITAPDSPVRGGYSFSGWYTDDDTFNNIYTFSEMPAENITLYAKWAINSYTITFNSNGGSEIPAITKNFGESVTEPQAPEKTGYSFDGWYSDEGLLNGYTFSVMPAENTTLFAKWAINPYTITFDSDGGSEIPAITKNFGESVTEPQAPEKEGYIFCGWYDENEELYTFTVMPAANITLYAGWAKAYKITLCSSGEPQFIINKAGAKIEAPEDPALQGYIFEGWYLLDELYVFDTMPAMDITLNARFAKLYSISFNSNGGSAVNDIVNKADEAITAPEEPIYEHYNFMGWYEDNETFELLYIFDKMPSNDLTLYAKWEEKEYTISFECNGGSEVAAITDRYNESINAPNNPFKEVNMFMGWYSDIELTSAYTFSIMPGEDITLYAKWQLITVYNLEEMWNEHQELFFEIWYSMEIPLLKLYSGIDFYEQDGNDLYVDTVSVLGDNNAFIMEVKDIYSVFEFRDSLNEYEGYYRYEVLGYSNIIYDRQFCSIEDILIGNVIYDGEGTYYTADYSKLIRCNSTELSYTLPEGVSIIGPGAFFQSELYEIELNRDLVEIGSYAFVQTVNIESIIIYNGVSAIYENAFESEGLCTIYCENAQKPENWDKYWNYGCLVVWGYNHSEVRYSFETFGGTPVESIEAYMVFSFPETYLDEQVLVAWYDNEEFFGEPISFPYFSAFDTTLYAKWINRAELDATEGLEFMLSSDQSFYLVTRYEGIDTNVYIPNTYNGLPVARISNYAFCDSEIKRIFIPSNITYICNEAFSYSRSLTNVIIESGLTQIGRYAFEGCTELSYIVLPESLTRIDFRAFYNCVSLREIIIPLGVETIEGEIYKGCYGLTIYAEALPLEAPSWSEDWNLGLPVIWGYGRPEINYSFITNCATEIESIAAVYLIELPSLEKEGHLFGGWADEDGEIISFPYASISDCTLYARWIELETGTEGIEYENVSDEYYIVIGYNGLDNVIYIPANHNGLPVREIDSYAFNNCSITEVHISEGITVIGDSAFQNCEELISVTLPESLTEIGMSAFYECIRLSSIVIPNNITEIKERTFYYNSSLSSLVIGGNVEIIGNEAFYCCYSLRSVSFPDSVKTIGSYAFSYANSLDEIQFGEGLEEIMEGGFYFCRIRTLNLPDSLRIIGDYAFSSCGIREFNSNKVQSIGSYAFQECYNLKKVYINIGVELLGCRIFEYSAIYMIYCEAFSSGPDWDSSWNSYFDYYFPVEWGYGQPKVLYSFELNNDEEIVPIEAVVLTSIPIIEREGYYFGGWYDNESLEGEPIDLPYISYDNITLYAKWVNEYPMTQSGLSYYFTDGSYIVDGYNGSDSIVFIPDTVEGFPVVGINDCSFQENRFIRQVYLGKHISFIGNRAFQDCSNLKKVFFNEGLEQIGEYAFSSTGLVSINLPESILTINQAAFYYCKYLEDVMLPYSLTEIESYVFANCYSLTDVTLSENIERIGNGAFMYCLSLKSISIPEGVKSIEQYAFDNCSNLIEIIIPDSVTDIGNGAFYYCHRLKYVYLGSGAESSCIPTDIFRSCYALAIYEVSEDNPNFLAIDGVLFNKTGNILLAYPTGYNAKTYNVPNGVHTIAENAFSSSYIKTVVVPDSVEIISGFAFSYSDIEYILFGEGSNLKEIGSYAFYDCRELRTVTLPQGLKIIRNHTFIYCNELESVFLPKGIEGIQSYAFSFCYNLTIYSEEISKPSSWSNDWSWDNKNVVWGYGLPVVTYTFETNGGEAIDPITSYAVLSYPEAIKSGSYLYGWYDNPDYIGEPVTFPYYSETNFTLYAKWSDTPLMTEDLILTLEDDHYIVDRYWGYHTEIIIPDYYKGVKVEKISYQAFYFKNMESVHIGKNIKYIGPNAFYSCSALTSVVFADGSALEQIDENAFWGCNIGALELPNSVETIGKYAFYQNINLSTLTFGEDSVLSSIAEHVFAECNIQTVEIPSSVTNIGNYAFNNNLDLSIITFSENSALTGIGERAFASTKITEICLPKSLQSIMYGAFSYCYSLVTVTFESGGGDLTIGGDVFINCTALTNIIIPLNVTAIGSNAFSGCILTINCKAAEKPAGWDDSWHGDNSVQWGYTG